MAQDHLSKQVSVELKDAKISDALTMIGEQGGFYFSYQSNVLTEQTVTKSYHDQEVVSIINDLFQEELELLQRGRYVILRPLQQGQKNKVRIVGKVVDGQTNKEISDVSIYEVGNLTATLSDSRGKFNLNANTQSPITAFAISKQNYRDTIVYVTNIAETFEIELQPDDQEQSKNKWIESLLDKSTVLKNLINNKSQIHVKNVYLQEERFAQLSFLPIAGTNGTMSGKVKNKISINAIAGYSHSLGGVEVGGVLNIIREDAKWVQIGGFGNVVGNRFKGVQVGGFFNSSTNYAKGVQLSGFYNYTAQHITGTQTSGFVNFSRNTNGLQLSGFANYTKAQLKGVQASGALNISGNMKGVQVSGLLNIAREVSGTQIGIVNLAKDYKKGIPIGLINLVKNGFKSLEYQANDIAPVNLSFRTGVSRWYTEMTAGINPFEGAQLWTYGYGFGSHVFIRPKYFISVDAKTSWIGGLKDNHESNRFVHAIVPSFGLGNYDKRAVTLGPVVRLVMLDRRNTDNAHIESFFSKRSISSNSGLFYNTFWIIGYQLSFRI
ncbi:MAG: hypothetical protein JXQ90_00615 [Cyclobacteriaceae bacterium]